jgi:VanZ family protein
MTFVEAGSQTRQVMLRTLAPIGLMAVIFVLSAQPDLDSGLGTFDLILRKIAHMTEYAVLTLLWAWALRPLTPRSALPAAAIALLYAITDEYHQTFVEGRGGTVVDVGIDAIGVVIALALLRYHRALQPAATHRGEGTGID